MSNLYCQDCGYCHYGEPYPDTCMSCSKPLAKRGQLAIGGTIDADDIKSISASAMATSDAATRMLYALSQANQLPVLQMLEIWWDRAPSKYQDDFTKSLLWRLVSLVQNGSLDSMLKRVIEGTDTKAISRRMRKLIEGGGADDQLLEAIKAYCVTVFEDEKKRVVREEAMKLIRDVAKQGMMNQREVIEAAVRDRMPSIEEMTEKVVRGVVDDATDEIRARVKRSDG